MIATTFNTRKAEEYFANKMSFSTGPVEVSHQIENGDDIVVVDVREEEDYRKGHVPGAVNLPQDEWSSFAGLSRETTNILYCYSPTCHLAAKAAQLFSHEGYAVMEMDGGFEAWKDKDLEVEK